MEWTLKTFEDLTKQELYEILQIRAEVFVEGQKCLYQDMDNKDQKSWHLYLRDNGEMVAYLRILDKGVAYPEIGIGRVLVKESYRGRGLGRELLRRAMAFIVNDLKEDKIHISAQKYLLKFYESLGFVAISDVYLDVGIEHVSMMLTSP